MRAWLGLKVVSFGIWLYEQKPYGMLNPEDKENLRKLWELYDKFEGELNESNVRT